MTLVLRTKSHGDVDSGFFSGFTKLARIGDYAFETKDLCELAQILANNCQLKELKIHAYPVDSFFRMRDKYMNSFASLKSYSSKSIDAYIEENQGKLSLEDKTDIIGNGITISIKMERNAIRIGKYLVRNFHFGLMACYLANGGWLGWLDNKDKPDFAEPTVSAIKKSKNKFYKRLKRFLNS